MHAQLSPARQAAPAPCTGAAGRNMCFNVAVRGRPWKADGAHRPSELCTPTALTARTPVRYTSVDSAPRRSTALQGDTRRDKEETARIAENSQLTGRFRRWWQVLGSNQRRLSRRFYRPSCTDMTICLLTCEYVASGDLRGGLCPSYVRAQGP
jgi:hypothetical protein